MCQGSASCWVLAQTCNRLALQSNFTYVRHCISRVPFVAGMMSGPGCTGDLAQSDTVYGLLQQARVKRLRQGADPCSGKGLYELQWYIK